MRKQTQLCNANDPKHCRFADEVSRESAARAVKEVFAILGVDIDDPASVEDFREDLRFGRKLRKRFDYGVLAIIGVVAAGIAAAVWQGIVSKIKEG